jgi:Hypoxia induced protein conserved region
LSLSRDPLFFLAAIACLAVVAVLLVGIGGFARGGEFNRKYANKIMRLRLLAQFIAVILIVLFVWLAGRG